jgi:hypothetical protein
MSHAILANDYLEAMKKSIDAIYRASSQAQLQDAVNKLERISAAETDKWEPQYYVAFGYIMMTNLESDGVKKDQFLDKALSAIGKAKSVAGRESEIIALEGFVHMLRVSIDPESRGPEYSPKATRAFVLASELDPGNPRALVLSARMQFGTAQFFGSSTATACALVEQSLEKFNTNKPKGPLAPAWGRAMAEALRQQCK